MRQHLRAAVVALAAATQVTPAFAALPPSEQRAREIAAIKESPDVARRLSGRGPVERIDRVGDDAYEIEAGGCRVVVRVVDDPAEAPVPGPRRFKLELGDAVCR